MNRAPLCVQRTPRRQPRTQSQPLMTSAINKRGAEMDGRQRARFRRINHACAGCGAGPLLDRETVDYILGPPRA